MQIGPSKTMPTKMAGALWTAMLLALTIKTSECWKLTGIEEPDGTVTFQLQATTFIAGLEVKSVKIFYSVNEPANGPVIRAIPTTATKIADDTWSYTSPPLPSLTSTCVMFKFKVFVNMGPVQFTPESSMGVCGVSNTNITDGMLSQTTDYTGEIEDDGKCGDSLHSIPISADMMNNDYMILSGKVDMTSAKNTPIVWVKMRSRDPPYGPMPQSYVVVVHGPPYSLFEIYECNANLCNFKIQQSTSVGSSGEVELKIQLINTNNLNFILNGYLTNILILSTATMSELIISGLALETSQNTLMSEYIGYYDVGCICVAEEVPAGNPRLCVVETIFSTVDVLYIYSCDFPWGWKLNGQLCILLTQLCVYLPVGNKLFVGTQFNQNMKMVSNLLIHSTSGTCLYSNGLLGNCTGATKFEFTKGYAFPIGMQSRFVPDSYITASSEKSLNTMASQGRLENSAGFWSPMTCSTSFPLCFFKVEFEILLGITGVILQGSGPQSSQANWVSSIDIKYLFIIWNTIFLDMKANFDNDTKVVAFCGLPKYGYGVQFAPKTWNNEIALRVEILTINWNWKLLQLNYKADDIKKNVYLQADDLIVGLVCYLYKPGDGSLYLYGPSLCSSVFSLPNVVPTIFLYSILLKPYIEIKHTYADYGLYEAILEERSERGSDIYTQIVNVNRYGCSIKGAVVTEDMQILVSEDFSIFARVDAQCIVPYDNYEYSWTIEEVSSGQPYDTLPRPYAALYFPALHFSNGTYTFKVSVTPVEFPANITNTVTVQILSTPLVVSIEGGRSKTVGEDADVEVNAAVASYDPAIQPRSAAGITFSWSCETVVGVAQTTELCGGQALDGVLVLPAAVLAQGTELAVTVSGSKDGRMTNYTQHLHIKQGEPADIYIRCIDNCESISSSLHNVILLVVCKNCINNDRKDFQWNVLDDGKTVADLALHTETGIHSEGLIILPGLLQINKTYEVSVTGLRNDHHVATSFYELIFSSPSTGGNCSSEQKSGIAGVTLFNFDCKGWVSPTKSAKGRLIYIIRASNTERNFLLYYSANPRIDNVLLPVGDPTNNYMLDIEMSICNANDECSIEDLQVQVLPPTFTESIVHNIIALNGSLWNKVNDGSTRMALGYIQMYATLIPLLNPLSTAEVVSNLLLMIFNSTKQIHRPIDCEQYSLALQYVTEETSDVLPMMDLISQSVSNILREAEAMPKFYKKTTISMSKALTFTAGNIVKSMKLQHEQKQNATDLSNNKASKLFHEVYNNILKDGIGVNKVLVPGGKNILLCTATLCVDRDVLEAKHLTEKTWATHFNTISFHGDNRTSPQPFGVLQIVDFRENPLVWNEKKLTNPVVGIQLQNNESAETISESQVAFNLPLTKRSINTEETISVVRNCTFEVCKAIVKYDIHTNGTMVFFAVEPLSDMAWIEAYIRRDNLPLVSTEAFDCGMQLNITEGSLQVRNCSLMHPNQQRRYFPLKMDNLLPGSYYTLLHFPGSNMTSMISLKVKQVVCLVKNLTDVWISGFGVVDSESTERRITCLFQQRYIDFLPTLETPMLTIADIFIPPNSIDFSTVFSKFDLASNGVVFGVIVAILVIYVLLSIWARRKDRRDHLKWIILPLKNADIDNTYIYIITVSTGMHPYASTTSNVFIRFNFEKRTSETFALDNGVFKGFDRGSVRAFTLPVPRYPGKPQSIQLWHDSSGCDTKRNWLLNEVQMHDLQTKETFCFIFNTWLGFEHNRVTVKRKIADKTDLVSFKRLLSDITKSNFSEGHMWSSVFFQYEKNNFTRLQRLGCCTTLIFLMMITNAMWFESDTHRPGVIKIGPFTPGEIFIMIASALMEIPISLMLVQIFHRQRGKNVRPRPGDGTLPYWTIYIAWAIIAVVILVSGFFIILFSMEWGAQKANRWLLRFFISFLLSLLLIQPLKVVIFSMFSTLKGKVERNHDDHMETYIAHYYSQGVETKLGENISASNRQLVNIPVINVEQMKRVTRQEKRRKQMRQDLFVYILYMVTLLLLAYRQIDENAFHVHMAMEKKYALDFEISDFNGYWSWLRDTVVSNMYPEELYARYKIKSSQRTLISDLQSHRVGSIRIRQSRSKALQDCNGSPLNKLCIKTAVSWQKDTDSYSAHWSFYNSSDKSKNYMIWAYQDPKLLTLPSATLFGSVNDYGTGGYMAHLGTDSTEVKAMVNFLADNQWMDMRTVAVFTEFFIYNPNVNLFCHVNTLVESVSGVLITSHKISVFRLKELDATLTHICYAAFIILTLYLAFITVSKAFKLKWRSLQNFPFWVNIFALSVGFCLLVVFYHRKVVETKTHVRLHNTPWTTEMLQCLSLSFLSMQLLGILAFLTSIRIFGILGSSGWLRPMVETMVFCSQVLCPFTIIFLVAMVAFGLLFWAVFGGWLERYSTLGKSMTSAVAALLGKSDFRDFQQHGGSLAAFLFLVYMFSFAILLLDLGILIVSEATSLAFRVQHEEESLGILGNPLQKIKLIYNNAKRQIKKSSPETTNDNAS